VACGGDEFLSKKEYLKRGDAICAKGDKEIDREAKEEFPDAAEGKQPGEKKLTEFARDVVIPNVEDQLEKLRDLPAPEGDEDKVSEIYDAADDGLQDLKEDPKRLVTEDEPLAEANKKARDYGFKECGAES